MPRAQGRAPGTTCPLQSAIRLGGVSVCQGWPNATRNAALLFEAGRAICEPARFVDGVSSQIACELLELELPYGVVQVQLRAPRCSRSCRALAEADVCAFWLLLTGCRFAELCASTGTAHRIQRRLAHPSDFYRLCLPYVLACEKLRSKVAAMWMQRTMSADSQAILAVPRNFELH